MSQLKRGNVVPIHQEVRPGAVPNLEGTAVLVRCLRTLANGLEEWEVTFEDEPGETYVRYLDPEFYP